MTRTVAPYLRTYRTPDACYRSAPVRRETEHERAARMSIGVPALREASRR